MREYWIENKEQKIGKWERNSGSIINYLEVCMIKKQFYTLHADICKTISNPNRQAILDTIRDKEMTVTELIKITGISQANLSQHLAILRSKGVVLTRREGNNIYYSISDIRIIKAYDLLSEVLQDSLKKNHKTVSDAISHNKYIP